MARDIDLEKSAPENSSEKNADAKAIKPNAKDEKAEKPKAKGEKAKKSDKGKKQKKSFVGSIVKYFKDAKSEFKKVVWPTPKETTHNTVVVIIVCALAALFIFGIDSLFGLMNKLILG
jgi:preprotein translocase subunit SecE